MAKTIKKILVPVNFSESYGNALTTAVAMCKRHVAALHLLHVKETQNLVYPPGKNPGILEMITAANAATEKNLEAEARQIEVDKGIRCYFHICEGSLVRTITDTAQRLHVDVIVLEKSKTGRMFGMMNGNEVYKVLKAVDCPVLTIPAEKRVQDFNRILFPVRPLLKGLEKLEIALPIMKRNNSRVLLFSPLTKRRKLSDLKIVNELANRANYLMGINNIDIEKEINFTDDMAQEVVNKAVEQKADLIIITATISSRLKSIFLKDYTEKIIDSSPVPVLSVKVKQA